MKTSVFSAVTLAALTAMATYSVPAQSPDIAMPISAADAGSSSAAPVSLDSASDASPVYGKMAAFLASQKTFYVELASTNTITGNGRNKVNGGLSRVWYRRPQHVVWTTQSDIGASALAIDGTDCTLYLPVLSKYMVSPVGQNFDGQLAAMSAPYGMLTTALFSSETSSSLQTLLSATPLLLGKERVFNVDCHHLRLPTRSGSVELWIADGPIPLPVKISSGMSIPASPGQDNAIESRTEVSFQWRVNVDLPDSTFHLKLPETAKKTDKLGSPVVMAALSSSKKTEQPEKKEDSKKSSSKSSSSKKRDSSNRDFKLAFEPPPNLDQPVNLPSAMASNSDSRNIPSLRGEDDIVAAAIRGSRPDSVPSKTSFQPAENEHAPPPPSSAAQSPSMKLNLLDGNSINLGAYKGRKAVVLDFWATWCGPCQQSMPVVSQVANSYRSRGVEFFAVNMAEDPAQIQQYLRQQGVSIPVALDSSGQLAAAFGVSGIPHLVVIGKDGTIKGTHTGADSNLAQNLMRDLETAIR